MPDEKLLRLFSRKETADPTRGALVALRRGRNPPIVQKRHERVNFGEAERGKTHKWGFSLSYVKHLFYCSPLRQPAAATSPKGRGLW